MSKRPVKRPHAGRPPHEPTSELRNLVRVKIAARFTQAEIAKFIGVDIKTLCKFYRHELADGKRYIQAKIDERFIVGALTDSNPLRGIYVKNFPERFGFDAPTIQAPTTGLNISFEDGGPGRVRKTPFDFEAEAAAAASRVPGADRLGDDHVAPVPVDTSPGTQTFIARDEPTPPSEPEPLPALPAVNPHEHRPLMDSPCAKCRMLGVKLSMGELQ